MCGIAGILKFNQHNHSQEDEIKRMIATLHHRGPDGWGVYLTKNIALAHTRLAIIDLTGGNQPMMTDRYVITYNGEVYNFIELREDLKKKGCYFKTNSDTEVILKSYEVYGINAIERFNGQFTFLLWDRKEKKLIAARDRYGIRPLYVLEYNNSYYFASEMKAFDTIKGYSRKLHMKNLFEHALLWNTIVDNTIFENIRSISSGTFEIYIDDKPPSVHRYYEIGESQGFSPDHIDLAMEELKELLNDSVNLRLRSDVPVANYLSGGIDSSIITYLTSKNKKEKFKTYSVSFEDSDFDESSYQQEMVNKINSNHLELMITYEMIDKNFQDAIYHFERPVFRTAPVPLYLLSRKVHSNNIKVVLTGEAADEILWGYDSYKELKLLEFWKRNPDSKFRPLLIKKLYPHLRHYNDPKHFGLMRMFYEGFLNDFNNNLTGLNIRTSNNKILFNYFNKDYKIEFNKEKLLNDIEIILPSNFNSWTLLQKNQFLEMKTLLQGYLLSSQGDRMSMAHSVEGRYPFLDHRIVEKVFYYKDSYKLKGFSQKHLLRESFRGKIPGSIIDRPKMPYMAPDLKSFFNKGKLTEMASYFLSVEKIKEYGIFDEKIIRRFINKYEKTVPDKIGYRDNMLIAFLLSTQIVNYNINNYKKYRTNKKVEKKVEIIDF